MNKKIACVFGLLGALAVSGYGSDVVAQRAGSLQIGGQTSNFGNRSLAPGFTPDPVSIPVTAGGNVDSRALNLGAGCLGFVTNQPDFILRMTGNSTALKVKVNVPNASPASPTDTTLLVNTPNGQWRCNDDTGGANPQVDLGGAGAGQYDIWIGSYRSGANARGQLLITELRATKTDHRS